MVEYLLEYLHLFCSGRLLCLDGISRLVWQGNNNRFLSAEECSNTCQHWARQRETELTCSNYLEPGSCPDLEGSSSTLPRWGFDPARRRCVPFYYAGCGGNSNNFRNREKCVYRCGL